MITYEIAKRNKYIATIDNPYLYLSEFVNPDISKFAHITKWAYDIELYTDFFSITCIPADTSKQLIKKYVKADMTNNIPKLVKTLRNMNCVIFVIREGTPIRNLINFIRKNLIYRIGFNNIGYDDPILGFINKLQEDSIESGYIKKIDILSKSSNKIKLIPIIKALHNLSNKIINEGLEYPDFKNLKFRGIQLDVMKLNRLDMLGISLKKLAVALQWYRLQDLPYSPGMKLDTLNAIEEGRIFNTLTYNINDTLITIMGFKKSRNEFKMRAGISKTFNVSVHSLSRSAAGDAILEKKYAEISGKSRWSFTKGRTNRLAVPFVDIIDDSFDFKTKEFIDLRNNLMRTTAHPKGHDKYKKFKKDIIFDGTKYTMALGGLHSVDRPMHITSTKEYVYRDADVRSYYPNLMLNLFVCPRHLDPNIFLAALEIMIHDRVEAKAKSKDRTLPYEEHIKYSYINEGLKISINNIFGKLGYANGWLYDLRAMYQVTINGQLKLFKLIEMLYLNGISVISANTDGVIAKLPKGKEDIYYETCKQWEREQNLVLEYTDYDNYLATSVNDYIAVRSNGDVKRKGEFVSELKLDKGYSAPIVPKALSNWFLNNIPLRTTIYNSNNVHDFIYSQKVGGNMELFKVYVDTKDRQVKEKRLQNTDRYYVSNYGEVLIKRYYPEHDNYTKNGKVRSFNLRKGEYIKVVNDLTYNHKLDNLHRGYYLKQAQAILDRAHHLDYKLIVGTKSKSGIAGNMFDNL